MTVNNYLMLGIILSALGKDQLSLGMIIHIHSCDCHMIYEELTLA